MFLSGIFLLVIAFLLKKGERPYLLLSGYDYSRKFLNIARCLNVAALVCALVGVILIFLPEMLKLWS